MSNLIVVIYANICFVRWPLVSGLTGLDSTKYAVITM